MGFRCLLGCAGLQMCEIPRVAPLVLFLLALATRYWNLGTPDIAVFDEVPYQEYISHYFSGVAYFNLHPPAGKLILALGAKVLGVPYATLANGDLAVPLRALPALAGALIVPVVYTLLLQLGAHRRVALLGAFLLLVDNGLISVSRLVLLDSLQLLFIIGALTAYLATLTRTGRPRIAFALLSAILAGLAVGTKWSGLAAAGMIGVHMAWRAYQARAVSRDIAREAGVLAGVTVAVYVMSFAIHFALLPAPDPGTSAIDPERNASMARKFVTTHVGMVRSNASMEEFKHSGASPWWSWPILKHPIYFWKSEARADGRAGHMMIEGNPVVWWGALAGMAAIAIAAFTSRGRARLRSQRETIAFLALGWVINFAPFAIISRVLFLYAYFPALVFSVGLAVVGVGALMGWSNEGELPRFPSRASAGLYWGFAALALVSYLFLAPISYGTPISEEGFRFRMNLLER
jgi:dolichyl-phosphate-mannose-protein mannosyltransferase